MQFSSQIQYEQMALQTAYQSAALKKLLTYLQRYSAFYKRIFDRHHIDINNIRSVDDLRFIPVTSKEDLQAYNWDFLCVPEHNVREYNCTTGTQGKPLNIALTEHDLERLTHNALELLKCIDGKAGDMFQLLLSLDRENMAGITSYLGIRKLGGIPIRSGVASPAAQWETINRLQPGAIFGLPSYILKMVTWAQEHNIACKETSVQKAVCIGERVRSGDFELNTLGKSITDTWPIKLYSCYAVTELQTAFVECSAGLGVHIQPDLAIVEVLNDHGDVLGEGEYGEVTVTTLGIEGMPLLRYGTGDICAWYESVCSCGRHTRRLSPVIGRKHQAMKYHGTTVYPQTIYDLLSDAPFIGEYVVEVFTNEIDQDDIRLHVNCSVPHIECRDRLKQLLPDQMPAVPHLKFHSADELQKLQYPLGIHEPRQRFLDSREL
jgi:phenylacetate-CoA ligase